MRKLLYQDEARLEYGRILWKNPQMRMRLVVHWTDQRHPYAERFQRYRSEVETLLESQPEEDDFLDRELRRRGLSLRAVVKEIPPVFGSFF